jgi:hypothetical protein
MTQDFVQRLLQVLGDTPREGWEQRVRTEFGGAVYYFSRRSPQPSEQVRELMRQGIAERTARHKVRGR